MRCWPYRLLLVPVSLLLAISGCAGTTWTFDPATGTLIVEGEEIAGRYLGEEDVLNQMIQPRPEKGLAPALAQRVYDLIGEANCQICEGQIEHAHNSGLEARAILGEYLAGREAAHPSDVGMVAQPVSLDCSEEAAVVDRANDALEEISSYGQR